MALTSFGRKTVQTVRGYGSSTIGKITGNKRWSKSREARQGEWWPQSQADEAATASDTAVSRFMERVPGEGLVSVGVLAVAVYVLARLFL